MTNGTPTCCQTPKRNRPSGLIPGLIYGLLPHTFCILFVVFSVVGATSATLLLKGALLNRNFFYYLIALSFAFATVSALIYLYRNRILSLAGLRRSWRYLGILYGTTITVNALLFLIIFPATANFKNADRATLGAATTLSALTLRVDIPCSGHAPLITGELQKLPGVAAVKFRLPNLFDITYDANQLPKQTILNLDVFKTYHAAVEPGS